MKPNCKKYFERKQIFTSLIFLFVFCKGFSQNPVPSAYPTTARVNYTREWAATAPDQSASDLITRPLTDVKQSTAYYDGFGRPMQTVAKQASPLGNDLVTANYYDPTTGNEIYKYLPFTSNIATTGDATNDGNFKLDRFQQQVAFYNTYLNGQPGETNVGAGGSNWAYSQTNYEVSPLNRPLNSYAPGVSWVGSQGSSTQHNTQQEFLVNTNSTTTNDQVPIWNISAWSISSPENNILPIYAGTNYGPGTLYKTITTDERGHQTITYKDLYGQLILKKVQLTATADNYTTGSLYTGWICTFYVYDDHGNLRFVITPNVVAQMVAAGSWAVSLAQADELCYRYEYDQLGHTIIKKTPGTPTGASGEIWMVYDERNRLVMEQDGNMRSASVKKWQYIQYDNLDRPIAKGLITDLTYYNNLSYHVSNAALSSNTTAGVSAWPIPANYSANEVLAQSFYDNYSSIPTSLSQTIDATANGTGNTTAFTTSYNVTPTYAQPITQSQMTQGMVTGTKAEVLGTNGAQYIPTVSFYDEKGRVIQTQSINYTTGKDIATTQYSWSGEVLSTLLSQNYSSTVNPQTHLLISKMNYDAVGRLLTITKTINSNINGVALTAPSTNPVTTVTFQYDELGNLKNKVLGNNLDNLAYSYNVRGWLLNINQGYINGSNNTNYFGMELGYDKITSVAPGNSYSTPSFNGNIEGTVWTSKGDGINRKYDLSYDNTNRLTAANFNQFSGSGFDKTAGIDFSVSGPNSGLIGYDANGNISGINQNGYAQGGSKAIDQLTYNYINGPGNSNRINYVSDAVNVTNSSLGDFHFPGAAKTTSSVDYTYDGDANTISDNNRSISSITYYNYPNLPQTITVTGKGTITYTYDAAGNKLRKQAIENNVTIPSILVNNVILTNIVTNITTTTTYVDGFVYKTIFYSASSLAPLNSPNTDVLQFIGIEDGRLRFKPALGAIPASFVHDYFERDNLGNIRVGITDEVQQDIYPPATGETVNSPSYPSGPTPQAYEAQYYSFLASDFVPVSTLGAWYTAMPGKSNLLNQTNGGIPANTDPYSTPGAASQKVLQLCGNTANNPSGDRTGLGITLKVMAGDQINIYGTSFWHNAAGNLPTGSYPISAVLANVLSVFGGSSAVFSSGHSVLDGTVFNSSPTGPTGALLSPLLNNSNAQSGTQAPYAGINYIIFDDQFRPVTVGFDPVSTTTDNIKYHASGSGVLPIITIPKNGYIYVFVSNQSNIDVYFDNLQVVQTRGAMLEEAHYYPSGLLMAGISDRAWNKTPNNFHYQGKEMQNQEWYDGTGLEEYDFAARFYDQQLGRWNTQDPAGQYASPYLGMGNNWMNGVDPSGESWFGNMLKSPWEDIKLVAGLFAWDRHEKLGDNLLEILSRFTWEAPQEALGLAIGAFEVNNGLVNKVSYFDGVTALNTTELKNGHAFTLGNFTSGPSNMRISPSDPTFQHEYGRYLQSKADGLSYLTFTALPNLFGNIFGNADNSPTSWDGNARALKYFNKYEGGLNTSFIWDFDSNPIPGFNNTIPNSMSDPGNQEALRRSIRKPGLIDYAVAAASYFDWIGWLLF